MIVARKSGDVTIRAPKIISGAGLYNTFQRLLPPQISRKSYYSDMCSSLKPGPAAMNVFVGLNASSEELDLKKFATWSYPDNDTVFRFDEYAALDIDEALSRDIPLLFTSFPSTKGRFFSESSHLLIS